MCGIPHKLLKKNIVQNIVTENIDQLNSLCKQYKVSALYVFGSATSVLFTKNSDIDFLISFNSNISIKEYSDNYFELHYRLKELFNREIDLVTQNSLKNPYFIKEVESTKQLIYEA